jgi:hypothetical protein
VPLPGHLTRDILPDLAGGCLRQVTEIGVSVGIPFVAAEPRVRAAVLGLGGALASAEAVRLGPPRCPLTWSSAQPMPISSRLPHGPAVMIG